MRVRVGNTDAEGRMAMADPLHYMRIKVSKVRIRNLLKTTNLSGRMTIIIIIIIIITVIIIIIIIITVIIIIITVIKTING